MSLTCTCTHLRIEHDGAKKAINDRRIGGCNVSNCICKEYTADKKSRARKNELLLASLAIPSIICALCVIGFGISWFVIDFSLEDYSITTEFEYKKFLNGTEVENDSIFGTTPDPKERVAFTMKMIVGFVFLSVVMFGSIFAVDGYYTSKLKQLGEGKTE